MNCWGRLSESAGSGGRVLLTMVVLVVLGGREGEGRDSYMSYTRAETLLDSLHVHEQFIHFAIH